VSCELIGESLPAPYTLESLKLHVKTNPFQASIISSLWRYLHLLLSASACRTTSATHPWLSIDISSQQGAQQQTWQLSIDGTVGWTNTRPVDRPYSAYYVGSINTSTVQKTLSVSIMSQHFDAVCPTCRVHALSSDAARWRRANGRALIGSGVSGCIGEFAGAASRDVRLQFTTVLKGTWNAHCHLLRTTDWDTNWSHGVLTKCSGYSSLIPTRKIDCLLIQNRFFWIPVQF